MDKESVFELQKIDCNCNDCIFMQRSVDKFKESQEHHLKMQSDYFKTLRNKVIEKANFWKYKKNDLEKYSDIAMEADRMKFQFDKSAAMINFGTCTKLNKEVQFIPNTCQLDTQECFKHRKDS